MGRGPGNEAKHASDTVEVSVKLRVSVWCIGGGGNF